MNEPTRCTHCIRVQRATPREAALFWLRLGAQALAQKHAGVIGAGIAGLAAAQQLQMSGFRVCKCKLTCIHTSACSRSRPPP